MANDDAECMCFALRRNDLWFQQLTHGRLMSDYEVTLVNDNSKPQLLRLNESC